MLPKNYILFYRNSDGYQQENIIISIRRWNINISIRGCYIRCQNQKINMCLRWSLMNRSARNNLNSDQENNNSSAPSSVRISQSQNTLKWQRYCAFKMLYYQRHHSRQDLLNKERMLLALKRNYYSNVPFFQCYLNKTVKIELANALQHSTRLKLFIIFLTLSLLKLSYSLLNYFSTQILISLMCVVS